MKKGIDIYGLLQKVRENRPVVHHLTNWVTIYDCANIAKVFGASPVMAHAPEEVYDMAGIASSLVLNIGTLTADFIDSMKIAARSANQKGIPVILDVCEAGATKMRDDKCFELLKSVKISVIKGNASEIARIDGEDVKTRGVDAAEVGKDICEIAIDLALSKKCTVVITGEKDVITNGKITVMVSNGHPMMAKIVGTGCMASSVIGSFCAVENNLVYASAAGLCCFEIAAEIAASSAKGPGSFKEMLYDAVYNLNSDTLESRSKISFL